MSCTMTSRISFEFLAQGRGSPKPIKVWKVNDNVINPFVAGGGVTTYRVDDIDEGLGVTLLEIAGKIDRFPAREDCLDK